MTGFLDGCGGGDTVDDTDAGATTDASPIPDGSPEVDGSGGEDQDQDGYRAAEDCDDSDPEVYPGTRQDCQSDCDYGYQVCLSDGTYGPCSAITDCDCDTPGETRVIDCGMCGSAGQTCGSSGTWEMPSQCTGEGACFPGQVEQRPCDRCGQESRLCNESCEWLPWNDSACYGDCVPGEQGVDPGASCPTLGHHQPTLCSTQCAWEPDGACTGACIGTPRTGTPDFKDEVCVEGGLTFIGADPDEGYDPTARPEHVVALSPYFIDVYEVTVARYRECVDAGGCTLPDSSSTYFDSGSDDIPVDLVTWSQAVDFCAWDGGRTLPTEAQWEKAARGPHPNDVPNPWGTDPATCQHAPGTDCGGWDLVAVDANPAGVSYYGLHQMGGNVEEWVADWMGTYAVTGTPPLDPSFPPEGNERYLRGADIYYSLVDLQSTVTERSVGYHGTPWSAAGFRCARPGQ
jgi:formylglycine-generating enzyme required for sulfatase activity